MFLFIADDLARWGDRIWLRIRFGFQKALMGFAGALYEIVGALYNVFCALAHVTDIVNVKEFIDSIYIILGVVVLFVVAYNILLTITDPEKSSGETSAFNMLKNIVITFILIALMPSIFKFSGKIISSVIDYNSIQRIILNDASSGSGTKDDKYNPGKSMAVTIFSNFMYPTNTNKDTNEENYRRNINLSTSVMSSSDESVPLVDCPEILGTDECTFEDVYSAAVENGRLDILYAFAANVVDDNQKANMKFSFFICFVGGIYLIWMLVSFCFDLAIRLIKIAFYQMVSPLCIACRLLPKQKDIFNKWKSLTIKAYCSVLVEVLAMSLAIYFLNIVEEITGKINFGSSVGILPRLFAKIFIIFGILTFAKQLPKYIEELLGVETGLTSKVRDKFKEAATGGVLGAAAVGGGILGSAAAGGVRSIKNARNKGRELKEKKAQVNAAEAELNKHANRYGTNGKGYKDKLAALENMKNEANQAKRSLATSIIGAAGVGALGSALTSAAKFSDNFVLNTLKGTFSPVGKNFMESADKYDSIRNQLYHDAEARNDVRLAKAQLNKAKAELELHPNSTKAKKAVEAAENNLRETQAQTRSAIMGANASQKWHDITDVNDTLYLDRVRQQNKLIKDRLNGIDSALDDFFKKIGDRLMVSKNNVDNIFKKNPALSQDSNIAEILRKSVQNKSKNEAEKSLENLSEIRSIADFKTILSGMGITQLNTNKGVETITTIDDATLSNVLTKLKGVLPSTQNMLIKDLKATVADNYKTQFTDMANTVEFNNLDTAIELGNSTISRVSGVSVSTSSERKNAADNYANKEAILGKENAMRETNREINKINTGGSDKK